MLVLLLTVRHLLRPPVSAWRPVFRGVDYYCEEVATQNGESGRIAAVRIDLNAPGVDVILRPLDPEAVRQGAHYFLELPDLALGRDSLDVLINTAIFHPGQWWQTWPGRAVRNVDMVVVAGRATHFWEHSYLFWADRNGQIHVNHYKPPKPEDVASAVWGIGLQSVQVSEGRLNMGALGERGPAGRISFLGADPEARRLFLLACENASALTLAEAAIRLGVKTGSAMDGGASSWLLFSPRAKGLLPFTGIRGGRPLGPWLGVRAQPLP